MIFMSKMPEHTGSHLVCFIFISLCLISASSAASQATDACDALCNIKEYHSDFIHHTPSGPAKGQLQLSGDTIIFPWASLSTTDGTRFSPGGRIGLSNARENVELNVSRPKEEVTDLVAMNANKQRDIVFDHSQSGDPRTQGLKNSLDIIVSGNSQKHSSYSSSSESGDFGIENLVNSAMSSKQQDNTAKYQSRSDSTGRLLLGNYMNIDVSGIDVKAINTVQGGSAVATSNIVIKPVQIINCPPEVAEKLK